MRAWLGLGSNLEQPVIQLKEALDRLGDLQGIEVSRYSSFYQTPPWGDKNQLDFINAVAEIETSLDPLSLLHNMQTIENDMGRQRDERLWGPRVIDIDLLLYADKTLQTSELILPHPLMHKRAFVLLPLSELDASIVIPGRGVVEEFLSDLDCDGILRLDQSGEA